MRFLATSYLAKDSDINPTLQDYAKIFFLGMRKNIIDTSIIHVFYAMKLFI